MSIRTCACPPATLRFPAALKGHFVALGVRFENTAGVDNHQAVAVLTKDRSVFFECTFEGHQDTLYAHSGLQYYKDCTIGGTVDFIFGRATAVFDSPILRVHSSTWFTVIAASSSPSPGLTFRDGTIVVDAGVNVPVYLGRPWRNAAFTVYINCVVPKVWEWCLQPDALHRWQGCASDVRQGQQVPAAGVGVR